MNGAIMAEPVARQGIRAPVPGRSPDPGVSGSGFAPRGHIVLVDDDQALRSLLVIRLMRAGSMGSPLWISR